MSIFLDTDVLAYQFDERVPAKRDRARQIFAEHAHEAVVSTQVLIELHTVLTRKLGRSLADALTVLDAIDVDVVPADHNLVLRAAQTASDHDLSIFDAMILEAAARAGCAQLWTEDLAGGSTLRGVQIINPFRADDE